MTGMCCLEVSAIHANSDVTTYMIHLYHTRSINTFVSVFIL